MRHRKKSAVSIPPKMKQTSASRGRKRQRSVAMPPTLRYRSKSTSNSRARKRACTRVLMREWLEDLLNNNKSNVLRWEDKEQKIFSIVWRHASSHGFDQSIHGDLFTWWAQHTGKLKKNNPGDHSTNKSTFRCGLHSLKDCIELTGHGEKKGEKAKRTYRFIDPSHPRYDWKRRARAGTLKLSEVKKEEEDFKPDVKTLDHGKIATSYHQSASSAPNPGTTTRATSGAKALFSGQSISITNDNIVCNTSDSLVSSLPLTASSSQFSSSSLHTIQSSSMTSMTSTVAAQSWTDHAQHPKTSAVPNFDLLDDLANQRGYNTRSRTSGKSATMGSRLKAEARPDGIISLELLEGPGQHDPPVIIQKFEGDEDRKEFLPNFPALGMPESQSRNAITHHKLTSGGNVTVNEQKQQSLHFSEIQLNQFSAIPAVHENEEVVNVSELDCANQVVVGTNDAECTSIPDFTYNVAAEDGQEMVQEEITSQDEDPSAVYRDAQETLQEEETSAAVVELINMNPHLLEMIGQEEYPDIFTLGEF